MNEIDRRRRAGRRRFRRQRRFGQPQCADRQAGVIEAVAGRPLKSERVHRDISVRIRPAQGLDVAVSAGGRPLLTDRYHL